MAKNTPKKTMTPFEKSLTAVIVIVILAVLAFAVFATYGKISSNIEQAAIEAETEAIEKGEQESTVRYMASSAGKTVDEYLAQYGLTLGGELKASSPISDMVDQMTVENYYKYSDENTGETTDINELLTKWGAQDLGITKDTLWKDVQDKLSISKLIGEDEFNDLIEQYKSFGYDPSSITADMTINEANDAIEAMMAAGTVSTPEPEAADNAETDAEPEAAPAE